MDKRHRPSKQRHDHQQRIRDWRTENAAVAFDGQHDGPNIIITDNDFEDPGVSPGAIRFFDFADVLSGPQHFSGVGGNTMHGDGPVISNELGEAIFNTTSNDIVGTTGDDTFLASAGNDHIDGLGGSDTIDMANAGAGGSVVDLDVGSGGVAVSVATGLDTLTSIENVKGSAGADYIAGGIGCQRPRRRSWRRPAHIQGRGGADHIDGGTGADAMDGGDGDDTYLVDNIGDTTVEGSGIGSGTDTVLSFVSYALGANVENLTLTDAGSGSENFETFAIGPITDGENGWKHPDLTTRRSSTSAATRSSGCRATRSAATSAGLTRGTRRERRRAADHRGRRCADHLVPCEGGGSHLRQFAAGG